MQSAQEIRDMYNSGRLNFENLSEQELESIFNTLMDSPDRCEQDFEIINASLRAASRFDTNVYPDPETAVKAALREVLDNEKRAQRPVRIRRGIIVLAAVVAAFTIFTVAAYALGFRFLDFLFHREEDSVTAIVQHQASMGDDSESDEAVFEEKEYNDYDVFISENPGLYLPNKMMDEEHEFYAQSTKDGAVATYSIYFTSEVTTITLFADLYSEAKSDSIKEIETLVNAEGESETINGVKFYIEENLDGWTTALWCIDNASYHLSCNLSMAQIKEILNQFGGTEK